MSKSVKGLGQRSERVLRALRQDIRQGAVAPGEKLPSEHALCERFGASRPTVRRAIGWLVEEGAVRVRPGSGMYVSARPEGGAASRSVSIMYSLDAGAHLTQAQHLAMDRGYLCNIFAQQIGHWDIQRERAFLKLVLEHQHPALIAFCSPYKPGNEDLLQRMRDSGVRVVHIEPYDTTPPKDSYIFPDYRQAGHMAAVQLMLAGYERIRIVRGNPVGPYSTLIEEGAAQALREHRGGYDADAQLMQLPPGLGNENPGNAAHQMVRRIEPGTGVICDDAQIASHVSSQMREQGNRVPEDVGAIGVELIGLDRALDPAPDALCFDRNSILQQAMSMCTDDVWRPVRKLVTPTLTRRGTVRSTAT